MSSLDRATLSERDICTKYITPAIESAGWDVMGQMREEVTFTHGRVLARRKQAPPMKKAVEVERAANMSSPMFP